MAKKVAQIVEEQVNVWKRQSAGRPIIPKSKRYPTMTISREFGARGAALAELIGRKTGFKVWDKEILKAISEELGSDEKFLETLDERSQQGVENTVAGFLKNIHTNENYLRSLIRVLKTIEEHGNSIIVGRGANYICKKPLTFHVRVVSPFQTRVAEFGKREGLSTYDARQFVEEKDEERAEFIRRNFYKNVSNPSDYHLIVNSKVFSMDQMAEIVLMSYQKRTGMDIKVIERKSTESQKADVK